VKIIAICGDAASTLAKNAHVFLDVNIEQEACPLNLAPTSSTTVMLALGDALAMVLLEARGYKLAVEVLNLLESHRIDDLVVVDDNNAPVGIVDSQDLTRLKLL